VAQNIESSCRARRFSQRSLQFFDQVADARQAGGQVVAGQAETDAQKVVQAEMVPGHHQHPLLPEEPLGKIAGVDVQPVPDEGDGRGLGRHDGKQVPVAGGPLFQDGVAAADVGPRARDDTRPHPGRQRQGGQFVGQHGGADGGVLVARPDRVDGVHRPHHPADAQAALYPLLKGLLSPNLIGQECILNPPIKFTGSCITGIDYHFSYNRNYFFC